MSKNKRGGFTLIELLVVVAIIGILAGILLPALGAVKERARKGTCKSTVMNLTTSCASYQDDWGEFPPDTGIGSQTTSLVIFLDGERTNGGPRTSFFSFDLELIGPRAALAANEYADPWGLPYRYDNIAGENPRPARGDPAAAPGNKINLDGVDIWAPHPDDPSTDWITNYRSD